MCKIPGRPRPRAIEGLDLAVIKTDYDHNNRLCGSKAKIQLQADNCKGLQIV